MKNYNANTLFGKAPSSKVHAAVTEEEKASLSQCKAYLKSDLVDETERQVLKNFIGCLDKDLAEFKGDMPALR
jgi:hypothetical protein